MPRHNRPGHRAVVDYLPGSLDGTQTHRNKLSAAEQSAVGNRSESAAGPDLAALMMITLIDDDDEVREATARLLRSLGYDVRTFESGRSFLNWDGLDDSVSCVIMDIMMPGIDGFELHRRLVGAGYDFPIIFLTALTDVAANARMRECGVHGILAKPCSERHLVDCVESALDVRRRSPHGG